MLAKDLSLLFSEAYEAIYVGSWSICGFYPLVKRMNGAWVFISIWCGDCEIISVRYSLNTLYMAHTFVSTPLFQAMKIFLRAKFKEVYEFGGIPNFLTREHRSEYVHIARFMTLKLLPDFENG